MGKRTSDPSPIRRLGPSKKGFRRSTAQLETLKAELYEIAKRGKPCTVRNVYYRAVSAGLIEKTEHEYKAVGRALVQMRRQGQMPYSWLTDHTRWRHKPDSYGGIGELLEAQQSLYRQAIWRDQPKYLEFRIEKDAMIGTIYPETERWDIPLLPCRGYPSLTFLAEAGEEIREQAKPTIIFYCGDWDPSGCHISKKVEEELRRFCPKVDLQFSRLAINEYQIRRYELPTRPTKRTDSRSGSFVGESVELDAMDPIELRRLCRHAIEDNIDESILAGTRKVEAAERETLDGIILRLEGGAA